jgi:two-component system heavy metal sensor histidine kinase CusS
MRSIRRRLSLALVIYSTIALTVAGIAIDVGVRLAVVSEFDAGLWARAKAIANDVEYNVSGKRLEYHVPSDAAAFGAIAVTGPDGKVLGASGPDGWIDLSSAAGLVHHRDGAVHLHQVTFATPALIEDGSPAGDPPQITVRLARSTASVHERLANLDTVLVAVLAATGIGGSLVMLLMARTVLTPLTLLQEQIATIRPGTTLAPIPAADMPQELQPVVAHINQLLARVEESLARERQFGAAMAHELRTPLAGLQTTIDVQRVGARTDEDHQQAWTTCADIVRQLRTLVADLLLLARADAGMLAARRQTLLLEPLLAGCWQPLHERALERRVTMTWAVDRVISCETDPDLLALVVRNLFDNALSHGRAGGSIGIACGATRSKVTLVVANDGASIEPADSAKVFQRMWRGDHARTLTEGHAGLGLTLCQQVVQVLGGSISATVADGWFEVSLVLPASAAVAA